MRTMRAVALPVVAALALAVLPVGAADDAVLQAMTEELGRSMAKLQMEDMSRPYFIAYRVEEVAIADCAATLGSLLRSDQSRRRILLVEVRVGEPALDNTNFLGMPGYSGRFYAGTAELPIDDDERELRRQVWLATDAAYKQALEALSRKKATLQNKTRTDDIPDFASQAPATVEGEAFAPRIADPTRAVETVRRLSAAFRDLPDVNSSTVRLLQAVAVSRYLNSEGSRFVRSTLEVRLLATASTQALDGMLLVDFVAAYGRSLADLPAVDTLLVQVKEMAARLAALRTAPLLETYNGPVLFEGQAAAELLAQVFVPRLLATRDPVAESSRMVSRSGQDGPFVDKLGARVLARFLSLADDPTLARLGDQPLLGSYPVDDDGVPTGRTELVANGTLKTLLATRDPVRGVLKSTGSRRGAGPAPSNLIVSTSAGMTDAELRQELLTLAGERGLAYGVLVRRLANPVLAMAEDPVGAMMGFWGGGMGSGVPGVIAAFKVFPDGREELVRNVELADVAASSFRDVVAASSVQTVTTLPFQATGSPAMAAFALAAYSGWPGDSAPLVSLATPSLLFEELTLKKPSGEVPKPPFAPRPPLKEE